MNGKSLRSRWGVRQPEIQQIEELLQFMTEHNLESLNTPVVIFASAAQAVTDSRRPFRRGPALRVLCSNQERVLQLPQRPPPHTEARPSEDLHMVKSPIAEPSTDPQSGSVLL